MLVSALEGLTVTVAVPESVTVEGTFMVIEVAGTGDLVTVTVLQDWRLLMLSVTQNWTEPFDLTVIAPVDELIVALEVLFEL